MELKILLTQTAKRIGSPIPRYATSGSAAMDLYACIEESITVNPGERVLIPNGFSVELPSAEYAILLFSRSGLAAKYGISLANGVGVIDSDYRGEIMSALVNHSREPHTVHPGDRISQMMVIPIVSLTVSFASDLSDTERGAGGFGSTGFCGKG